MAVNTTYPDWYLIGVDNYGGALGYAKNSAQKVGGYSTQRQVYTWEALMNIDVSGIPAGSTISSVVISATTTANSCGGATYAELYENKRLTWTDNGTDPRYLTFDTNWPAWPPYPLMWDGSATWTAGQTMTPFITIGSGAFGTYSFASSATLVALWQAYVDGTKPDSTHKGYVFSINTASSSWFHTLTSTQAFRVDVTYTGSAPTTRRRIILS